MGKVARPTLVVRNVLLSSAGELLLGLRSDTTLWELPGGKVDDETTVEAGVREQYEETGIVLSPERGVVQLGFHDVLGMKDPTKRSVELYLGWRGWEGFAGVMEDAHLQWRWYSRSELPPDDKLMPGTRHFCMNVLPLLLGKGSDEVEQDAHGPGDEVSLGPVP